jgi:hypothetical protein
MSEIKVNKISPRTACGTTTLGDSGDTFTIPAGVTITNNGTAAGFGATGAASWDTTVKTSGFTAVSGVGYFCNTTSGGFSVNLPAGTAGAVVAIKDYAGTFDTGTLTLVQNGSDKIGGLTVNATLDVEGIAVTLVFIDSTQGWLVTDSGLQSEAPTAQYITATGGTPTTSPCGDYKIHTFTGPGALCVSNAGNSAGNDQIEYLVVAGGGGGGGQYIGGGGGGGGFRFASPSLAPLTYPAKPLAAPASLTASVASFPITVGGGGTGNASSGATDSTNGLASSFSTITSAGGGFGKQDQIGNAPPSPNPRSPSSAGNGGSGGGGSNGCNGSYGGGNGNTPAVSPSQGTDGGNGRQNPIGPGFGNVGNYAPGSANSAAAGGGGAIGEGAVGNVTSPSPTGGVGGNGGAGGGIPNAFGTSGQSSGGFYYFSGGGGGNGYNNPSGQGAGGLGGGGGAVVNSPAVAGTTNTGGGGGGTDSRPGPNAAGAGGSGIVIIRYKFQN